MSEPHQVASGNFELKETLDEKVELLFEELELAIHWGRPSILIAVYESEYLRISISKMLEIRLAGLDQTVSHFHIDEKQFDLPMILVQNPDHEKTVFFITGLKWGGGKGGFNAYRALNMRREFFVDNEMRIVLWLTRKEAANLPRHAPDFWAFRHRVVEFIDEQSTPNGKSPSIQITWDGWKPDKLMDGIEEKINLRESMLAELPEGMESIASRADLLYNLSSYYWAKNEYDKADELLDQGLKLALSMQDPITESQFLAGKGIVHHSQMDYVQAITAYQKAIQLNPYNTYARNNLAVAYVDLGENIKAVDICKQAIQQKPKNSEGYVILGAVYRQSGQFEDAKDCYQTACRLDPKAVIHWINLGDIFTDQQRNKEALRAYLKASRLTPDDPQVWKKIGDSYLNMNRVGEAKKTFKKALSLSPNDQEIQKALSDLEISIHEELKSK
jgi:tetratricopeptide (TPR) repeat protein